jgi:hypothetical protein
MCAFRSAHHAVVVDVPVLFRAGFPALLPAAEYNPRLAFFFLPAPRSRAHPGHACTSMTERETFFYRCLIEFSSILYIFLFACCCFTIFRYVHVVEQLAVFELRRI